MCRFPFSTASRETPKPAGNTASCPNTSPSATITALHIFPPNPASGEGASTSADIQLYPTHAHPPPVNYPVIPHEPLPPPSPPLNPSPQPRHLGQRPNDTVWHTRFRLHPKPNLSRIVRFSAAEERLEPPPWLRQPTSKPVFTSSERRAFSAKRYYARPREAVAVSPTVQGPVVAG